jgi:hypothetical protein
VDFAWIREEALQLRRQPAWRSVLEDRLGDVRADGAELRWCVAHLPADALLRTRAGVQVQVDGPAAVGILDGRDAVLGVGQGKGLQLAGVAGRRPDAGFVARRELLDDADDAVDAEGLEPALVHDAEVLGLPVAWTCGCVTDLLQLDVALGEMALLVAIGDAVALARLDDAGPDDFAGERTRRSGRHAWRWAFGSVGRAADEPGRHACDGGTCRNRRARWG